MIKLLDKSSKLRLLYTFYIIIVLLKRFIYNQRYEKNIPKKEVYEK